MRVLVARLADAAQGHRRGRRVAGRPLAAAEMVLVRIAYAADLPTPDEVIRSLDGSGAAPAPRPAGQWRRGVAARGDRQRRAFEAPRGDMPRADAPRGAPRAALAARAAGGEPLARAEPSRDRAGAGGRAASRSWSRSPRRSATSSSRPRSNATCGWCAARTAGSRSRSSRAPPRRWSTISRASSRNGPAGAGWSSSRPSRAQPTVKSQAEARQAELKTGVRADPLVQAVLARFPGAEIVDVRAPDRRRRCRRRCRGRRAAAGTAARRRRVRWRGLDPRRRIARMTEPRTVSTWRIFWA